MNIYVNLVIITHKIYLMICHPQELSPVLDEAENGPK